MELTHTGILKLEDIDDKGFCQWVDGQVMKHEMEYELLKESRDDNEVFEYEFDQAT